MFSPLCSEKCSDNKRKIITVERSYKVEVSLFYCYKLFLKWDTVSQIARTIQYHYPALFHIFWSF